MPKRVGQAADSLQQFGQQRIEFFAIRKFHIFLCKIQFEFEEPGKTNEFFTQSIDFSGEFAAQLFHRQAMRSGVVGGDEVANRLGLCEV